MQPQATGQNTRLSAWHLRMRAAPQVRAPTLSDLRTFVTARKALLATAFALGSLLVVRAAWFPPQAGECRCGNLGAAARAGALAVPRKRVRADAARCRILALVEDETVALGPGLGVITGESGAGKSVHCACPRRMRHARPGGPERSAGRAWTARAQRRAATGMACRC